MAAVAPVREGQAEKAAQHLLGQLKALFTGPAGAPFQEHIGLLEAEVARHGAAREGAAAAAAAAAAVHTSAARAEEAGFWSDEDMDELEAAMGHPPSAGGASGSGGGGGADGDGGAAAALRQQRRAARKRVLGKMGDPTRKKQRG